MITTKYFRVVATTELDNNNIGNIIKMRQQKDSTSERAARVC